MWRPITIIDKIPEQKVIAICRDGLSEDCGCSMVGYLHLTTDGESVFCTPDKECNLLDPDFILEDVTHYISYNKFHHLTESELLKL